MNLKYKIVAMVGSLLLPFIALAQNSNFPTGFASEPASPNYEGGAIIIVILCTVALLIISLITAGLIVFFKGRRQHVWSKHKSIQEFITWSIILFVLLVATSLFLLWYLWRPV